jgi:hypothetical protein
MFDHRNSSAGRPENAERVVLSERCPCRLFKNLHLYPSYILVQPLIENLAEKGAPIIGQNHAALSAIRAILRTLDQRQKAYVPGFDILEKPVDFERMPDIVCVHHTQDIACYSMLL